MGAVLTVVAALLGAVTACTGSSSGSCYPGDKTACACAAGAQGFRTCGADGTPGACACPMGTGGGSGGTTTSASSTTTTSSSTSASTGAASSSGGADGGLLPFLAACTQNAQCTTGLCFDFPAKGDFCTKPCTSPADCPAPSPGCNGKGVCKAP